MTNNDTTISRRTTLRLLGSGLATATGVGIAGAGSATATSHDLEVVTNISAYNVGYGGYFRASGVEDDAETITWEVRLDGDVVQSEQAGETFITDPFQEAGWYTVGVVVEEADDNTESGETEIRVVERDAPVPVIRLPQEIRQGEPVTIDGSNSTPSQHTEVPIESYRWIVTRNSDAATGETTGESFSYAFEQAGEYEIDLIVTDEEGNVGNDYTTFEVV